MHRTTPVEALDLLAPYVLGELTLPRAYGDLRWDHRQDLANWLTKVAARILEGQKTLDASSFVLESATEP